MEEKSVEKLIEAYLASKSQVAAAELLSRYGGMVYSVVRNIINDVGEVEDVYQEAWLKAFQSLASLRDPTRFGGWIKSIAARTALDHFRSGHNITLFNTDKAPHPHHDSDVLVAMEVRKVVSALPEHYRSVIILYYFLDFSCGEIADVLGIVEGTVMSRLRKAREILERKLAAQHREGLL